MTKIIGLKARQILDTKANPAIEVECYTDNGIKAIASVPTAKTTSEIMNFQLVDGIKESYYGFSVQKAVQNINTVISEELVNNYISDQGIIDAIMLELDGTDNKSNLGANTIWAVSLACAKAGAISTGQNLYRYIGGINSNVFPIPHVKLISSKSTEAKSDINFSEISIIPAGFNAFSDAYRVGSEIYHYLSELLRKDEQSYLNLDGSFSFKNISDKKALDYIMQAIDISGYKAGEEVFLSLQANLNNRFNTAKKVYKLYDKKANLQIDKLLEYYIELIENYPIVSFEDPVADKDMESWQVVMSQLGEHLQIAGNSLFSGIIPSLIQGLNNGVSNAVVVQPPQIATVTELMNMLEVSKQYGLNSIFSVNSGSTEDGSLADLAVGTNASQIKMGNPASIEYSAIGNRMILIEDILGGAGRFTGLNIWFLQ